MLSRFALSSILFSISFLSVNAQGDALPPNAEAGKCYAKCLLGAKNSSIRYEEVSYAVYIGTDPSVITEYKVLTTLMPETVSVEKSWPDCIPVENDNCIYTEEEDIPGQYEVIKIPMKRRKVPKHDIVYETYTVAFERTFDGNWNEVFSYPVYIGSDPNLYILKEQVTSSFSTRWEKKKGTGKCLSPDPNDCLVWCLVEQPEKIETIKSPINIGLIPETEIAFRSVREAVRLGGNATEWREVLCGDQVTEERIVLIQHALKEEGHFFSDKEGEYGETTKAALRDFQRNNGLPIGSLDLESLKALGVSY